MSIVTPEWIREICFTLDGRDTPITDDPVKSNAIIQGEGNPHYKDIYLTTLEELEGEDDDI